MLIYMCSLTDFYLLETGSVWSDDQLFLHRLWSSSGSLVECSLKTVLVEVQNWRQETSRHHVLVYDYYFFLSVVVSSAAVVEFSSTSAFENLVLRCSAFTGFLFVCFFPIASFGVFTEVWFSLGELFSIEFPATCPNSCGDTYCDLTLQSKRTYLPSVLKGLSLVVLMYCGATVELINKYTSKSKSLKPLSCRMGCLNC